MKIALVGSGNVASVLGRVIVSNNHHVIQVISREKEHAKTLADELGASYSDFTGKPDTDADMFILAIADQAIDHFFTRVGIVRSLKIGKNIQKAAVRNIIIATPNK